MDNETALRHFVNTSCSAGTVNGERLWSWFSHFLCKITKGRSFINVRTNTSALYSIAWLSTKMATFSFIPTHGICILTFNWWGQRKSLLKLCKISGNISGNLRQVYDQFVVLFPSLNVWRILGQSGHIFSLRPFLFGDTLRLFAVIGRITRCHKEGGYFVPRLMIITLHLFNESYTYGRN